jgi:FKBP-type peptidyl-prolyl cis-trans isomerase SlyD
MNPDVIYTVTEVYDSHVVLDGNHPLAGSGVRLPFKVLDVRTATDRRRSNKAPSQKPHSVLGFTGAPAGETLH